MWPRSRNSSAAAPAGLALRAMAVAIDGVAGVAVTLLLAPTAGRFFARRAVVTFHIGDPHSLWKGPLPFLLGIAGEVVYLLPFAFLLVLVLDPVTGATIGKRVAGLRVCGRDGLPATTAQRWARWLMQTAGLWLFTIALVAGSWHLLAFAVIAGVVTLAVYDSLGGTTCCIRA